MKDTMSIKRSVNYSSLIELSQELIKHYRIKEKFRKKKIERGNL